MFEKGDIVRLKSLDDIKNCEYVTSFDHVCIYYKNDIGTLFIDDYRECEDIVFVVVSDSPAAVDTDLVSVECQYGNNRTTYCFYAFELIKLNGQEEQFMTEYELPDMCELI